MSGSLTLVIRSVVLLAAVLPWSKAVAHRACLTMVITLITVATVNMCRLFDTVLHSACVDSWNAK